MPLQPASTTTNPLEADVSEPEPAHEESIPEPEPAGDLDVEQQEDGRPENGYMISGTVRPDLNPMRFDLCLPIPFARWHMGTCGHPGCHRPADYVGNNRVCDGCGALDPFCESFTCDSCLPQPCRRDGATNA